MSRSAAELVRWFGGLALAFVAFLLLRPVFGRNGGIVAAGLLGVAGGWLLPRLVLVRALWTVPLFGLLLFVGIQIMFLVPGDPFASEKNAPAEVRRQQLEHYGIPEKSFVGGAKFFWNYVSTLVETGYMGPCIKVQGRSVTDVLIPALPVSMTLGLLSLLIATGTGLFLGIRSGLRPNTLTDYGSMGFAMIGVSLPSFVVGAMLMVVFALGKPFTWLPVAGWGSYGHLILPSIALALPYAAYIARLARSGTLEVMSQDFIRTARAKGLPERAVVLKHALKGAILPVVSFLGPAAAGIVTGSFVIETLFAIPGMGRWFVSGAINRDYYVVLGTMLLECGIVLVFNLLVDLSYAWLDPRVRGKS
jgi:oligopeptide transport system permease protein